MNKIKVVIVDDNKEFCDILEKGIKTEECFEVIGKAHDGIEGIELIKRKKPDLVILDIVMPKADGLDVLETLKSQGMLKDTKVVMSSALGTENIIQKTIALGAEYYVVKPFDLGTFVKRLKYLFEVEEKTQISELNHIPKSTDMIIKASKHDESLENIITNVMHKMGIPAHLRGYLYIRRAIEMVLNDVDVLSAVTKELYPNLAKEFNTTPTRVERAIRHAIELSWSRGNQVIISNIFGPSNLDGKPTNSHFIASVAERIRLGKIQ